MTGTIQVFRVIPQPQSAEVEVVLRQRVEQVVLVVVQIAAMALAARELLVRVMQVVVETIPMKPLAAVAEKMRRGIVAAWTVNIARVMVVMEKPTVLQVLA
tara:strand:+ start:573 stop:875 length:303 start_codon:yes stop_codon:yes gene_type:complete